MGIDEIKRIGNFIVLCLLQVVVFNHIHLFGIATPMLNIVFLMLFPCSYPRTGILLWSFAMGLVIDIFGNTPGVAATTMTILGAMQPYLIRMLQSHEIDDEEKPSIATLGTQTYFFYLLLIAFAYCFLFFSLEMFSIDHLLYWMENVVGSTVITVLLVFIVELLWRRE